MNNFLLQILEVNLLMAALFGAYLLVKRFLSFGWQRLALLSIPLLSLLTIIIRELPVSKTWSYKIPVFELQPVVINSSADVIEKDLSFLFGWLYWAGVSILAFLMLFRLGKLFIRILRSERKGEDGYIVASIDENESGSFFRFILLSKSLRENDRDIVFQHEKLHAKKLHSFDRLFMEITHCLSWFNPILILMKKELIHVHEFEVDRIMYNQYRAGYMECLLAHTLGTGSSSYLFTNQFVTKLTLIKRIKTMKQTSKTIKIAVLALPVIAGVFCIVSLTSPREKQAAQHAKKEIHEAPVQQPAEMEVIPLSTTDNLKKEPVQEEKKVVAMPLPKEKYSKEIYADKVDYEGPEAITDPEFKGGNGALTAYMAKNIHYPKQVAEEQATGTVYVSFVVKKSGKIADVSVKRGVNNELNAEAKRVIAAMPDWIPAEKDGEKIDAEMVLPVSFKL